MMLSLHELARIGGSVNAALASGRHDKVEVDEVLRQADAHALLAWLETVLGPAADFTWLSAEQRAELNDEWGQIGHGLVLDEVGLDRRSRGLGVVLALIFEGMQRRAITIRHVHLDDTPFAAEPGSVM